MKRLRNIVRLLAIAAIAVTAGSVEARTVSNDTLVQIQKDCKYTELWGQRATLFNTLGCDSTDIVMLGNSLTHGCEWHELPGMEGVLNRGINGDIVEGLRQRIDAIVDGHPRKIFLLAGANDVSHNLTADSIAGAVADLVELIRTRSPQTQLYVQSLLPVNNSFGRYKAMIGKEQLIRDVNARLKPLVEERGAVWIDLHPHFCDADGNLRKEWTNDGLHLLPDGYRVWHSIILPYVTDAR